jgi:2,3-diketo-5-methylthio-1-phosphopentane phosphatase
MKKPLKIFSDFDGTISLIDTGDLIVDSCIGQEARRAIDDQIVSGQISFREGFIAQFAGVDLTWEEVCELLRLKNGLDPTFAPFVRWTEEVVIPLVVLSSGFEQFIRAHLASAGLEHIEIRANQVSVQGRSWRIHFRDDSPSGHDKAGALKEAHAEGYRTLFIGDGVSDIPAASVADLLFAKKGERLARYCIENGIAYHPFANFSDVLTYLKQSINHQ